MLLYSKPSQYALRAISYIVRHQHKGACRAETIASSEDIPKHYLSKLLKRLVEKKILISSKGPGGGFVIAKDPKDISAMDVIRVFDNIDDLLKMCAIGWARCSDDNPCALHHTFDKLRTSICAFLETVNLAVFVEVEDFKKAGEKTKKK